MNPAQQQLIEAMTGRFGAKAALTAAADIAPWLTDWRGRWTGASGAILQPATTEEVAALVTLAFELNVPLVAQGGNTSMVGGATPPADGSALIVSLRRMNRIRSIEPGHAVAEAGVILETLHHAAADTGQRFPLTLGSRGSATIGGLTSTNAGGTQVLRFGTMRGLVEGVEAVLPDGTIHNGLAGLKKDNRGPSIDQLLIGAEGTLGLITAVRLRLVPAAYDRAVAWVQVWDPHRALSLLRHLQRATERIEAFELLPDNSLWQVLRFIPGTMNPLTRSSPWHVLVEATSTSAGEEPSEALLERLLAAAHDDGLIGDAAISASEAQADALWRIRDSVSEAHKKEGPALQHDISVPVDAMPSFLVTAAAAVEHAFPGTYASGFGHLGDGNIHFHVRPLESAGEHWIERDGPAASRLVHDLVTAAGGSISAEHGIGQMKRTELARLSPDRVAAIRALKAGLDPKGLMNPGKLV